jgi:endo-1,4-beta-xylanase
MKKLAIALCFAISFAVPAFGQVNPCSYTTQLTGGTTVEVTTDWQKTGSIPNTEYEYYLWHNKNENTNKVTLKYYGASQGGGAAFKGEWNESNTRFDYLARIGFQFEKNGSGSGKFYTEYDDIFADYSYERSARLNGQNYSYIGIYGWARAGNGANLVEYYIVDDWWGNQSQSDATPVGTATTGGSVVATATIDGATYNIVKNSRTGQPSIEGDNTNFDQYFSIRQTTRKCGTISITEHFKAWEKAGLKLGKLYEAKLLAEVGAYGISTSQGYIDYRYASMRMGSGGTTPSSNSTGGTSSSSSGGGGQQECGEYQTSFCGGLAYGSVPDYSTTMPTTGNCLYIGDFEVIQPNLNSTVAINGVENTCGGDWDNCSYNTKPAAKDGGYYVYVKTGTINSHQNNGWQGIVAKAKPACTSPSSSSSSDDTTPILNSQLPAFGCSPANEKCMGVSTLNSKLATYYTIKGEPLGNAKPQKAGVYIVKQGSSVQKIVVR